MKKLLRAAPEVFANFVAPYLVYEALDGSYGDVVALIASALPPLAWSLYELMKTRRLDAISVIVVASIFFTLAATAMGGSARMIQIRDAMVTGAVGVIFLITMVMKRPIIFYLARATVARRTPEGEAQFEALWLRPGIPAVFRMLTAVWGTGLIVLTALLCLLAWVWPIGRYLLLSPFIQAAGFGLMMLWSFAYLARKPGAMSVIRPSEAPAGEA